MNGDEGLRRASMRYGPLLDSLQRALEAEIGPLLWRGRVDAERTDHGHGVRVGPIFGSGVALMTIDQPSLTAALNRVCAPHGFQALPTFVEEVWGEWHITIADGHGALLTISLFGVAKAWVDVAA